MAEGTIPDIQTSNKDRILFLYLELNNTSSALFNQVTSCAPGSIYYIFLDFRQALYELYACSYRYKNFSIELKKRFNKWKRKTVSTRPSNSFIFQSIALYDDLVDELVRIEVLEL